MQVPAERIDKGHNREMSPPENQRTDTVGRTQLEAQVSLLSKRLEAVGESRVGRIEALESALHKAEAELAQTRSELGIEKRTVERLVSLASEAVIVSGVGEDMSILANSRIRDVTGLSPDRFLRDRGDNYTVTTLDKQDVKAPDTPQQRALRGSEDRGRELVYHFHDRDVTLLANAAPVFDHDGNVARSIATYVDISRRVQHRRRSELLNVLTNMLSSGILEERRLPQIARLVGQVMGAWTVLGLTRPEAAQVDVVATYHPDSGLDRALADLFHETPIVVGEDPGIGKVAATGAPILMRGPPPDDQIPTSHEAFRRLFRELGCDSLLIAPLRARGNILGVLLLVSLPEWPPLTDEDLDYTQQLVDRIAATLDSVQLLSDLRRKEWRMRMLAQISRTFSTSLDVVQVVRTVAAQVTDALADWCTIGLLDDRGKLLLPFAAFHRKESRTPCLQKLANRCVLTVGEELPGQVVSSQTPYLLDRNDLERLEDLDGDNNYRQLLRTLKPSSYLSVPLSVGGMRLGYIDLACDPDSGRKLGDTAFSLVIELAHRAASAIQNAQLFEELQAVVQAKDDWLSVASHELKTPLTPLQVLLQLMARKVGRGEELGIEHLDRCLTQVSKLTTLINDLLDVSRLEMGQLELSPEFLDLRVLVAEVLESFRDSVSKHELLLLPGGEGLRIEGDRARIQQVVRNLVHNSIKYSPDGGVTRVQVRREEVADSARAVVSVEDEGIGIPEDEQPRLFQRYFRGSNVSERNYGGLGLGLWISNEIVVRHHGQLWADSQSGKGSRFSFWLPLYINGHRRRRAGDPPLVLLVDDDDGILETAAECLFEEGYEVAQARNGHAALTVLTERDVRLVLLDLMMPMMDGWGLMRRIKRLPDGDDLEIIVMSATQDLDARAREMGASGALRKPFDLEQLLARVLEAIGPPIPRRPSRHT